MREDRGRWKSDQSRTRLPECWALSALALAAGLVMATKVEVNGDELTLAMRDRYEVLGNDVSGLRSR